MSLVSRLWRRRGVNKTQKIKNSKRTTIVFLVMVFISDLILQRYFRSVGVGVANEGISFGLFPSMSGVVTVGIYLVFTAWFLVTSWKGNFRLGLWALALGGLGNLWPRLLMGSVWDYIRLPLLPFSFNLSDALITGGTLSYLWSEIATSHAKSGSSQ